MTLSVTAVGVNPQSVAFQGAALHMQRTLDLPQGIIDHFLQQHRELTSPGPLGVEGMQRFATANVDVSESLSPMKNIGGIPNSGLGPVL